MKGKFYLACLLLLTTFGAYAQPVFKWGDDTARAKENYTLFSDSEKSKDWATAEEPMNWLLENTPDLNKSLYQKGISVVQGLIEKTEDEAKKTEYQDLLLDLHDRRIKYFGEEAYVLNRKGYYALSYWATRPEKYEDLFELYKKIVELNKDKTYDQNIKNYMYMLAYLHKSKQKEFTEDEILTTYDELTGYSESNFNKATDDATKKRWEDVQDFLDARLNELITVDCDFIKRRLIPKIDKVPANEKLAFINSVLGKMVQQKCTNDPQFLELSKLLFEEDPNYKRAVFIYKAYLAKEDYATANTYMDKAIELAETNADKASVVETRAKLLRKGGSYSQARTQYFKLAELDPAKASAAYTAVGDMYMASAGSCKGTETNQVHSRAIYIAAYNMYQRAGNGGKMAIAKRQWPPTEQIFTLSLGGASVNVNCWVGETVTIPQPGWEKQ